MMSNIFFMNPNRYISSLRLLLHLNAFFNGLKSIVSRYFEPMALLLEARFRLFCLRYDIVKAHGGIESGDERWGRFSVSYSITNLIYEINNYKEA